MATKRSASVYVTNSTSGSAVVTLLHRSSPTGTSCDYGQQSGEWVAQPGETVGPLTVYFPTGIPCLGQLDLWSVQLSIMDGPTPGVYTNPGTSVFPGWKECQLQHKDSGQSITLTASTTGLEIPLPSGGCSDSMKYVGPYGGEISHVFVLMLENHSFDNVFALSGINGIQAATTSDCNTYNGTKYCVQGNAPTSMPTDPGHEFPDVVEQLCGPGATYRAGTIYPKPINNSGFAANYATTTSEGPVPPASAIGDIMMCFNTPEQLPVINQLANDFAICDHWYSSLPGPTWPNRFFVHGASSAGLDTSPSSPQMASWVAQTPFGFVYPHGSIYDLLDKHNGTYRLYGDNRDQFSDDPPLAPWLLPGAVPQVAAVSGIGINEVNSFSTFASDLMAPYPYSYTFIEPYYGDLIGGTYTGGSSQHPMDDVYGGEGLIKAVYEAIRASPVWSTSVLIITYDEHGGYYDSVAPPQAVAPADGSGSSLNEYGFTFQQYGVRVPAVVVSPLIAGGTVDHTVYDHASVPATVEAVLGLPALTQRDDTASNVLHLLTETTPRTDCPVTLVNPAPPVPAPAKAPAPLTDPIPESGNLPAFLWVLHKSALELSADDAERQEARERFNSLKTRQDAADYARDVLENVAAIRAAPPPDPCAKAAPAPAAST